jgi:hypothetical protein
VAAKAFIIKLMIFTTTAPQLPGARLSAPALLVVSVIHLTLFWMLLQTAPVQRVVRETVVMLNLPITQPMPKPPPKKACRDEENHHHASGAFTYSTRSAQAS